MYLAGDGNVIQCNVRDSIRDITERKKVGDALRQSEERFRLLVSSVQDYAIIVLGSDGRVVSWNEGAERIKGYRAEEIVGQHFSRFYPREDTERGKPDHELKVAEAEGRFEDQGFRVRKDGSTFWANVVITAERDETGRLRGFSKVTRDITDRKRPEEERDRFFNTSLDMLCIAKSDGYFKRLNPSFTETLGWSMEELVERPFIEFVHPDDRDRTLREVEKQVTSGEIVLRFENRYQHKDGSWRWLSWRSVPQQGGLMYATARDVTDQRQAEVDIAKLNAALQDRTSQLEAAYKELEAFSYSVSHDLRAPLRAIDGFSKAVLDDYGAQLPPEAQRDLQSVREGAQQMGALIDALLTFSRLSRQPLDSRTLDTVRLVHQSLEELHPQQQGRTIELRIGELPPCRGDCSLLKQVWINLLSNALKYSSKRETAIIEVGAVVAPVSGAFVEAPPAAGTAASTNHEIAYFVRDNGVGFDMRYAHKLFGVFQRLHRAEDYDGTGVGLAIAHRIIHRHGGRVWAEAAVDRGATFYFTLENPIHERHNFSRDIARRGQSQGR